MLALDHTEICLSCLVIIPMALTCRKCKILEYYNYGHFFMSGRNFEAKLLTVFEIKPIPPVAACN